MSRPCPDPASHGAGARISCSTGWSWCSEISRKFAVVCCARIRSEAHKAKEMFPWITPGRIQHSQPLILKGILKFTSSKLRASLVISLIPGQLPSKNGHTHGSIYPETPWKGLELLSCTGVHQLWASSLVSWRTGDPFSPCLHGSRVTLVLPHLKLVHGRDHTGDNQQDQRCY